MGLGATMVRIPSRRHKCITSKQQGCRHRPLDVHPLGSAKSHPVEAIGQLASCLAIASFEEGRTVLTQLQMLRALIVSAHSRLGQQTYSNEFANRLVIDLSEKKMTLLVEVRGTPLGKPIQEVAPQEASNPIRL